MCTDGVQCKCHSTVGIEHRADAFGDPSHEPNRSSSKVLGAMRCRSGILVRKAADSVLTLLLFSVVVVSVLGFVNPAPTSILCDDVTIRRTFVEDTVSISMLMLVSLLVPFIMMVVIEWLQPQGDAVTSSFRSAVSRGYSTFGDLFVGQLFTFFINDFLKMTISEPRPHFWQSCSPNITSEQCAKGYVTITWRDCTNPSGLKHRWLVDSMKSFPSAHATISMFSAIFMIGYIHARIAPQWSRLLPFVFHLLWLTWGLLCCTTRIIDNRHHWWDVAVGAVLGATGGVLSIIFLSNGFTNEQKSDRNFSLTEERATRYSRTSVKRLISTTSETDTSGGDRIEDRELHDINGVP